MFTGLIEGTGAICVVDRQGPAIELTLDAGAAIEDWHEARIGDSVAINGCCLTIVRTDGPRWTFQAGEETLSLTNLGQLRPGSVVNLERSLRPTDRLGGHFVQGHVDGVGEVERIEPDGEWTRMWFRAPERLTPQMVAKGSIAVDGVSLTLVQVESTRFSVALIPHTLQVTTLGTRQIGDRVNLETDIIGKYIEKMLKDMKGRLPG